MEAGLIAIWLLACMALGVAGIPLTATLFPRLPDRGAAFALPLALMIWAIVAYWIGYLSLAIGFLAGLIVLFIAAIVCLRTGVSVTVRPAIEVAIVFSLTFLFLVAVRAVDPAVHPSGGEKFLDFGLLTSLLRATQLPPEDFWFAGKPVQYYYGGHLIAALLTRLTGIDPRYSYNLALATFYATLVTAVYGLGGAITAQHGASRRVGGTVAAFFVGIASNLVTVVYVLIWVLPVSIARPLANALAERSALSTEAILVPPGKYSYWTASRVVEGTVNEFPLFAWLNGDLHAHMMSTPFLLLVAAIGYSYTRTPATDRRRRIALVIGLGPLIGLLTIINTWSIPTAVGLTWLTLTFAPAHPATLLPSRVADRLVPLRGSVFEREMIRTGVALLVAAGVLFFAVGWSIPFWLTTASSRSIGVFPNRSSMSALVLVYGAFLFVFVPYLLDRARPSPGDPLRAVVAVSLVLALALVGGFSAIGLFGPLLIITWLLLRGHAVFPTKLSATDAEREQLVTSGGYELWRTNIASNSDRPVGYESVLLLAGLSLILLVEFFYVDTQAGSGRYNTVFKIYMQVWVLWGVAVGVVIARFLDASDVGSGLGVGWRGAHILVAGLLISTSLYAGLVLTAHFEEPELAGSDGPTLDALAFVSAQHPEEAAAIDWLDAATNGRQPNIVSAPGTDTYRWVNAPSSLTGVPTVAGWAHEVGYRGPEVYEERVADVDRIYTGTPAQRTQLLREYDVQYVYVGPVERNRYDTALGFEGVSGLEVAFQNDAVTIYAVDHDQLGAYKKD